MILERFGKWGRHKIFLAAGSELKSLTDLKIKSINLNNLTQLNRISEGNVIISTGSFAKSSSITNQDGSTTLIDSSGTYANLDLTVNQSNSTSYVYTDTSGNVIGDYTLNLEALSLPMLRGYGNVKALPIAASENDALLQALKGMKNLTADEYREIDSKIENIIFLWSGVENVTGMRGVFDGKKLAAMEKIRGENYRDSVGRSDVQTWQVTAVSQAWDFLFFDIKTKILAQSVFKEIFNASYNFATDSLDFFSMSKDDFFSGVKQKFDEISIHHSSDVNQEGVDKNDVALTTVARYFLKKEVTNILTISKNAVDGLDEAAIKDGLTAIFGTSVNNALFGSRDIDDLRGKASDEIFVGGKGNDFLSGSSGDDTYLFNLGDGKDTIDEYNDDGYWGYYSGNNRNSALGSDAIQLGAGITKENIIFFKSLTEDNLIIGFKNFDGSVNQNDQITIRHFFSGTSNIIETIRFDDGSTFDLTDKSKLILNYNSDETDNLIRGSELVETIDGKGGDDTILSYEGSDTLIGSKGNDFLSGSSGDDTYLFNLGDGKDTIDEYNDDGYWGYYSGNNRNSALGSDAIQLGAGITKENIIFFKSLTEDNLIIGFKNFDGSVNQNDQITIRHFFSGTSNIIETIRFDDGSTFDLTDLDAVKPLASNDNFSLQEDRSLTFKLSDLLANDFDIKDGDALKNTTLENFIFGNVSHGTLIKNSDSITYTPNPNYNGTDQLTYQIKDADGVLSNTASISFSIAVINDAPVITNTIHTQSAKITKEFIFKLPTDIIFDVDGDALQIQVKKSNGSALPSWLTFDVDTLELKGTPPSDSYGLLTFSLIVSDGIAQVQSNFGLVIDANLQANTTANVITVDANNSVISSSNGNVADLVLGDNRDNILEFKSDGNWTSPYYYAWNPYTNDWVSIHTQIRSFDAFDGREGYDILNLTSGNDTIFLDDRFSANSSKSGARLAGIEEIKGSEGNDVIDLSSNIFTYGDIALKGESGNDLLWSNDGDDFIGGGIGNDNINGGRGNDILKGDEGDDIIKGFDGYDIINGGAGADILIGGRESDIFTFTNLRDSNINASDLITDFTKGQDRIDFSALGFTGIANESEGSTDVLTYHFEGTQTIIEDQNSSFAIKLNGHIALTNEDFVF